MIQDCDNMKSVKKWFAKFASKILDSVENDDPNAQRTIDLCLSLGGKKSRIPNKTLFAMNVLAVIVGTVLSTVFTAAAGSGSNSCQNSQTQCKLQNWEYSSL